MNEKIRQYQLRLFNKLFSTLPSVKKLNSIENDLDLNEPISHIYYFNSKDFWYGKGESEDKFIFIFGPKNKSIHQITTKDATLIIDFDKDTQFNSDSLGLFSVKNSEIHILINNDVLNKKYPNFNTLDLKPTKMQSIDKSLKLNVLDLGSIDDDFIDNLEKLILNQQNLKIEEKTETSEIDKCKICSKKKSDIKIDSQIKNLQHIRPELCGKCIEKIVVSEFYVKVKPLLKGNDTKILDVAKEKFANDQLFDYGLKLLEKYEIIKYIGIKKLFFTIDNDSFLVSRYGKFSDENDLLIDKIFQQTETKTKSKKKEISMRDTTLTRETKAKMNLFINALKSGKTHEDAYRIANVKKEKVENWYKYGQKGDTNYIPFYNEYKAFHPENVEKLNKMETFLDELNTGDLDNALKKSDLTLSKVRAWYSLGEKEHDDYKDFYLACRILLPEGIPKKESKKIVNNDELMNEFITLIDDGKTNEEAISQLKIPKFKVKNWINQGKLGNKKYVDFYNAYMIQIQKKEEVKKAKKREKKLKKQKQVEKDKPLIKNETISDNKQTVDSNDKFCKLCGRKLNKKSTKEICRRCSRKQYASKILLKLLQSIKPEIPFKKDDLKILGLSKLQITDYIWTLQEFNLIIDESNKYKLKNKESLDDFIKSSGIDIDEIETPNTTVKLSKTCKKCGKTLEISKFFTSENSADGFEDYCKDCKKMITSADYLKEISEIVDYGSVFTEYDLKPHFPDQFKLQARLWSLLDNDLAVKNFENETYLLADRKTCEEFLNKYYEEKIGNPQVEVNETEDEIKKDPKDYTKADQMKIIIKEISAGKSRKEAAETAHIPLYKITHWYTEGRQGYGKDNVNFYQQLKGLEKINANKNDELKNRMNLVLDELKEGIELSEVKNSNETEINEWIEKGKRNIDPFDYFYELYGNIILKFRSKERHDYKQKEINRKIFLENLKTGKSKEECARYADIELSLVHEWYLKGKDGEEPYEEFYEKYTEIKNNLKKPEIPQIKKTDQFGNYSTVLQMNIILKNLCEGMGEIEAVEKADISYNTYKYWINRGKQEFGEIYTQFYEYVNKIKNGDYHIEKPYKDINYFDDSKLTQILTPLPEKYEESFKSSKMNRTGIAWVNIIGKQWVYQRNINNHPIKFSNSNIYKLYDEVKENNLPWGVRDLTLAKNVISGNEELNPEETKITQIKTNHVHDPVDPDIYAPLPEKYEDAFKSNPMNQSGIAWVNNPGAGTKWIYEKRLNGQIIKITDENIYGLHKKVKAQNHVWGIRDYSRAKKIIDIPDNFKIPERIKSKDKSTIIPDYINPEIYAPLPKELELTFNPSQANKTGIAWVNKSGSKWRYSRIKNNENIAITDENIYELFNKVKKQNLEWGIRDYDKAKQIIKIPKDYNPPKEEEASLPTNQNILAPLPDKYKGSFNPSQPNRTGIAWVNKIGNQWVYQRKVNGIPIKFSDPDIYKLHEIVLRNNHIWGVLDIDKAKKSIDSSNDKEKIEDTTPIKTKQNISVLNLGLNEDDDYNLIIKGKIRNNEFLKILNQLSFFEIDIKQMMTNTHNNKMDLFIELNINSLKLKIFEGKINELGWTITE